MGTGGNAAGSSDGKHVETGRDEEEQECVVNICDQSS